MKKLVLSKLFILSIILLASAIRAQEVPIADEAIEKPKNTILLSEQADMERTKPLTETEPVRTFAGRLPSGYRNVITPSQREEIHNVQQEYHEAIERLKIRIRKLEEERNERVASVLSGEQRHKLRQIHESIESERLLRRNRR